MKIQVGHSRDFDYQNELYIPLKKAFPQDFEWIFPHEFSSQWIKSEETLKWVNVFLAEVSYPATGLGIELGFAYLYKKRIVCISQSWIKISSSLKNICEDFIEYVDLEDLSFKLRKYFKEVYK